MTCVSIRKQIVFIIIARREESGKHTYRLGSLGRRWVIATADDTTIVCSNTWVLALRESFEGCVGGSLLNGALEVGVTVDGGVSASLENIEVTGRDTLVVVHVTRATSGRRKLLRSSIEKSIGHTASREVLAIYC